MTVSRKTKQIAAIGAGIGGVALTAALLKRLRAKKAAEKDRKEARERIEEIARQQKNGKGSVVVDTSNQVAQRQPDRINSKSNQDAQRQPDRINSKSKQDARQLEDRINSSGADNFHQVVVSVRQFEDNSDLLNKVSDLLPFYMEEVGKQVDQVSYEQQGILQLADIDDRLHVVFDDVHYSSEPIKPLLSYIDLKILFIQLLEDFKNPDVEKGIVSHCSNAKEMLEQVSAVDNDSKLKNSINLFLKENCEPKSHPQPDEQSQQASESPSLLQSAATDVGAAVGGIRSLVSNAYDSFGSFFGRGSSEDDLEKKNQMKSPRSKKTVRKSVKPSRKLSMARRPTIATKSSPRLWKKSREQAVRQLGGKWSARAAQLATKLYKKSGGKYVGKKSRTNSLQKWTLEDWGTKSGKPSGTTGERYLPKLVRERLSPVEYARTTSKKRQDTRRGIQWSPQPKSIRRKTAKMRKSLGRKLLKKSRKL
jgi:hypothetical protein